MSRFKIKKKTKEKPVVHEQWIEIRHKDGKVVPMYFPSNEEFEKERLERDPEPTMIYRRFNFVGPVPTEYMWTNPPMRMRQLGGLFLQRMSVGDWLNVMKKEREMGNGVPVSCSKPLRRPEAFGPCHCDQCTEDRARGVPGV